MKKGFEQWKRLSPQREARLDAAINCYIGRRNRVDHPEGEWDNSRRWYPSEDERQECCGNIRYPSRRFPYSLNKHCRSAQHIALLYRVDPRFLRRRLRWIRDNQVHIDAGRRLLENLPQESNIARVPGAPSVDLEDIDQLLKEIERLIGGVK